MAACCNSNTPLFFAVGQISYLSYFAFEGRRVAIALDRLASFLARAQQLGWVPRVAENRYFPPATLHELERIAAHVATEYADGTFAASDFNRASGIGRNLTIQVLEYFDRIGTTRRKGDRRAPLRTPLRISQS